MLVFYMPNNKEAQLNQMNQFNQENNVHDFDESNVNNENTQGVSGYSHAGPVKAEIEAGNCSRKHNTSSKLMKLTSIKNNKVMLNSVML